MATIKVRAHNNDNYTWEDIVFENVADAYALACGALQIVGLDNGKVLTMFSPDDWSRVDYLDNQANHNALVATLQESARVQREQAAAGIIPDAEPPIRTSGSKRPGKAKAARRG